MAKTEMSSVNKLLHIMYSIHNVLYKAQCPHQNMLNTKHPHTDRPAADDSTSHLQNVPNAWQYLGTFTLKLIYHIIMMIIYMVCKHHAYKHILYWKNNWSLHKLSQVLWLLKIVIYNTRTTQTYYIVLNAAKTCP